MDHLLELDRVVGEVADMSRAAMAAEIEQTMTLAQARHSRDVFRRRMDELITENLPQADG